MTAYRTPQAHRHAAQRCHPATHGAHGSGSTGTRWPFQASSCKEARHGCSHGTSSSAQRKTGLPAGDELQEPQRRSPMPTQHACCGGSVTGARATRHGVLSRYMRGGAAQFSEPMHHICACHSYLSWKLHYLVSADPSRAGG